MLLSAAQTYHVEESGVLMLYESDFPAIFEEFPHIMIEFYDPNSEFCKRLYPVYNAAAKLLAKKLSTGTSRTISVVLGKVDITIETGIAKHYDIKQYPTIYFFVNGDETKLNFTGERTEKGIVSWTEKQLLPTVMNVESYRDLKALSLDDVASVVLYSDNDELLDRFLTLAE